MNMVSASLGDIDEGYFEWDREIEKNTMSIFIELFTYLQQFVLINQPGQLGVDSVSD